MISCWLITPSLTEMIVEINRLDNQLLTNIGMGGRCLSDRIQSWEFKFRNFAKIWRLCQLCNHLVQTLSQPLLEERDEPKFTTSHTSLVLLGDQHSTGATALDELPGLEQPVVASIVATVPA